MRLLRHRLFMLGDKHEIRSDPDQHLACSRLMQLQQQHLLIRLEYLIQLAIYQNLELVDQMQYLNA